MATLNIARAESAAIDLTEVARLEHNEIYCLPYGSLSIRVIRGIVWITSQAEDYLLEAGDQMMISRQPHAVIVSAVGHKPLSLKIRKNWAAPENDKTAFDEGCFSLFIYYFVVGPEGQRAVH